MSNGGRPNYKGINSQSFAALSLLLQYISRSDFVEIKFEQDKLEDFVLVFSSGKRIICESKYRQDPLTLGQLKSILDKVLDHKQLSSNDEILVITEAASGSVKSVVNNFRYFHEDYRVSLKTESPYFNEKHFQLFPQVRLWEVAQITNREGILLLMSRVLSSDGPFWLPKEVLEDWVNTLLVQEVYLNSESGGSLTKKEFYEKLDKRKITYLDNNGVTYEEAKQNAPEKIESVIAIVTAEAPNKRDVCANAISELVVNPMLHYYLLQKLSKKKDLVLQDWDVLWRATSMGSYSMELFKIFENNINTEKNQKYILSFISVILDEYAINYFREDFIKKDIVDVCQKIFTNNQIHAKSIFELIKTLYDYRSSKYLYEERGGDDSWEREEISLLLQKIYNESTDEELKQDIIEYILNTFNIVEDDGKYWHYTPPQLFQILQDHIKEKPEDRILWFAKIASSQYQKFYQRFGRKIKFEGWEHMGGGISQSGNQFSIVDKHFISHVIYPALLSIPKRKLWRYITSKLITKDQDQISAEHPDFLNRACINLLIEEYKQEKHAKEAFEILESFIKMRKGIPWKPDIIFQSVRNSDLTDEKKWNLVKISLAKYKQLPVNVFVEQIVTQLANKPLSDEIQKLAVQTIIAWAKDPNYRKNRSLGSYDVIDSVFKLLNNSDAFENGIEILRIHLNSEDFINSTDTYDSWDVGRAVALVLQKYLPKGLNLLEEIYKYETLSINQQSVLTSALDDIPKENKELLSAVYDKFLGPKLAELKTIAEIEKKFFSSNSRELIVRYSENLVSAGEHRKALDIVKLFIDDSDPPKDGSNSPEDPKGEFNKHKQIEEGKEDFSIDTVRGNCAWTLRHYALLPAREYIEEAVPLVKTLATDPNHYVRLQATFPLIDLVKNRDTYLPDIEPKKRFIKADVSKQIEDIAFTMLRDSKNHKLPAVMKGLVHVFSGMRAIDEKKAKETLTTFINTGFDDVLHDVGPLLVFFAEFRKKAFKNWPWGELADFDDFTFKTLLEEQIKEGKDSMKRTLSWEFWRLPAEGEEDQVQYNKDLFNISVHYLKLFTEQEYNHDIWEHIYHFIEDYLPYEFESCFELWKACVLKEKPYLTKAAKDKNNLYNIYWWPFFYNGKVLLSIYDHRGIDEFLKWVDFMVDYPADVYIANDFGDVISKLKTLPKDNKKISQIFDRLIKRGPSYYDDKQEWLN